MKSLTLTTGDHPSISNDNNISNREHQMEQLNVHDTAQDVCTKVHKLEQESFHPRDSSSLPPPRCCIYARILLPSLLKGHLLPPSYLCQCIIIS